MHVGPWRISSEVIQVELPSFQLDPCQLVIEFGEYVADLNLRVLFDED